MEDIPLHNEHGNATFLRDVATPKDANFIQTNVVRVNGKRQVYIPVFRQLGSSTLDVVNNLKGAIDKIQARLTRPGIDLKVVHGPVGLRPPFDHEPGGRRGAGGGPLLAGDPACSWANGG